MPKGPIHDTEGALALYRALGRWAYHTTVETTVFLKFEDRATIGVTFGEHIEAADIDLRNGDETYKVDLDSLRVSVYYHSNTETASIVVNIDGEGTYHPDEVRLSKGARYR